MSRNYFRSTSFANQSFRPGPPVTERKRGLEIITLDFKVPPFNSKEGAGKVRHHVEYPKNMSYNRSVFDVHRVLYHGSDWLEIHDIIAGGCSQLMSKIFCAALKEGGMNGLNWRLEWIYSVRSTTFEVENPRPREGHFKLSMYGEFDADVVYR